MRAKIYLAKDLNPQTVHPWYLFVIKPVLRTDSYFDPNHPPKFKTWMAFEDGGQGPVGAHSYGTNIPNHEIKILFDANPVLLAFHKDNPESPICFEMDLGF